MGKLTGKNGQGSLLARHEGPVLFSAPSAMLKGLLEADIAVSLVTAPDREPFDRLFELASDAAVAELLTKHDLRLAMTPEAARGVTLAVHAAASGRAALACVPNDQLITCLDALERAAARPLARGGSLCFILQDSPASCRQACPRRLAGELNLPCLEPSEVAELRDLVEGALRVSKVGMSPVALVVHDSILRTAETFDARPNRVIESVDAMLARRRRRRRPRFVETEDVLRVLRRLELNRAVTMPNPGERVPVGFVTVGPAEPALRHLIYVLRLAGRVPHLRLGTIHPIDETVVARILSRCDQVVVLEPRPGVIESAVLRVAEAMRCRGERPATVWGRLLPDDPDGRRPRMAADESLHPSVLARRITHLLHRIRPSLRVGTLLAPVPAPVELDIPRRCAGVGIDGAMTVIRRVVAEVDQWLHDQRAVDSGAPRPPTALAVEGSSPPATADRAVNVELWSPRRLRSEGAAALRHAARQAKPWIVIIADVGGEGGPDPVRLVDALVPADQAHRFHVESADLNDPSRLAELLRESALADRLTVIVVGDGPPARYDVRAVERGLCEIDRLGFEPRQRVIWPVARICAVREPLDDDLFERTTLQRRPPLRSELRVDQLPRRVPARFRFRARPLLEQAEVIRNRPPARRWRSEPGARLPVPEIVHRRVPQWRVHLAGYRGRPPGVAARVLCDVGARMGYAVRCVHDHAPIAAGRRAWAQILFTHPRGGEAPPPLAASIPFGEADLLLGLDATETLRALAADRGLLVAAAGRTYSVVNVGLFSDERNTEESRAVRRHVLNLLREHSLAHAGLIEDFAAVCRTSFHTDRVADVALLGAAFQLGLIPATLDAVGPALASAEAAGFGRTAEAFRFGRHLAADRRLFTRPRQEADDEIERLVRLSARLLGQRRSPLSAKTERFRRLLADSLNAMPGLAETELGRQAVRDFVMAMYRCFRWGALGYAERYAGLITLLYRADRGDSGRALTRDAVLPLADVMLIRDPLFISSMATGGVHRRHIRRVLNVKRARQDELRRRFLTRFELVAFGRRYRADIRTSDWPARLVSFISGLVPRRWRGTPRERALREDLIALVRQSAAASPVEYERYQRIFSRLHQQALDDRLRGMALAELRMMASRAGPSLTGNAAPP